MDTVTEPKQIEAGVKASLDRYGLLQIGLWSLRAGPALILVLLIVIVGLTTPVFLTSRNIGNVFSQTSVIAVVALGQLLVIVSRGIDLSVGATIALSGVVGAIVYEDTGSSALVIAAILGTGLAVGAVNGLIFVYGRVPHPFIVTLATLSIVRGIALWASDGTLDLGHAADRADDRRRLDQLAALLDLRRHRPGPPVPDPDDADGLGPLAVRRRRQPGGGAAREHPDSTRPRHGLRAQRARRGHRRADHRGPDRRRLADRGRSRRARLDRGGDHRRRRLRRRPRATSATRSSARSRSA